MGEFLLTFLGAAGAGVAALVPIYAVWRHSRAIHRWWTLSLGVVVVLAAVVSGTLSVAQQSATTARLVRGLSHERQTTDRTLAGMEQLLAYLTKLQSTTAQAQQRALIGYILGEERAICAGIPNCAQQPVPPDA